MNLFPIYLQNFGDIRQLRQWLKTNGMGTELAVEIWTYLEQYGSWNGDEDELVAWYVEE